MDAIEAESPADGCRPLVPSYEGCGGRRPSFFAGGRRWSEGTGIRRRCVRDSERPGSDEGCGGDRRETPYFHKLK